jgi:hypothetical protein
MTVPASLRRWFVIHFVADIIFEVPLVLVPASLLRALGWPTVDPLTARMVGAALAGIGIESLLCRNDGIEAFRTMLRLKCIWSGAAIVGPVPFSGAGRSAGGLDDSGRVRRLRRAVELLSLETTPLGVITMVRLRAAASLYAMQHGLL